MEETRYTRIYMAPFYFSFLNAKYRLLVEIHRNLNQVQSHLKSINETVGITSLQDKQMEMADFNLIRIVPNLYLSPIFFLKFGVHENDHQNYRR